jgi:hypothetical protein
MSDENVIKSMEGLDALAPGEWVIDADGDALCLIDTHLGWPQRMWMPKAVKGRVGLVVSLEHARFPVALAEIDPEYVCKHGRGTNECGHCYLCGVVVSEPRHLVFDDETLEVVREAGRANAAYDAGHRSTVLEFEPPLCECASVAACWCDGVTECAPCASSGNRPHVCALEPTDQEVGE